jgi:hemerythrin-like metal-binding protein
MSALTWSEALALQQPQMDTTHREFVDLLAAVEAALDGPPQALQARFADFVAHTEAHFAQEDRWMAALGFAKENCHAFQHAHVLGVLRDVQATAAPEVLRVLVVELAQWFPQHAQAMDAALAQVMAECGFDPASGRAQRTLEQAITGCGSGSCGT